MMCCRRIQYLLKLFSYINPTWDHIWTYITFISHLGQRTLKYIYLCVFSESLMTQLLFSWLPSSSHKSGMGNVLQRNLSAHLRHLSDNIVILSKSKKPQCIRKALLLGIKVKLLHFFCILNPHLKLISHRNFTRIFNNLADSKTGIMKHQSK